MRRIAAPMVGGMITAPLLSMFVVPVAYLFVAPASRGVCGSGRRAKKQFLHQP